MIEHGHTVKDIEEYNLAQIQKFIIAIQASANRFSINQQHSELDYLLLYSRERQLRDLRLVLEYAYP